jgi:hypothetical protein
LVDGPPHVAERFDELVDDAVGYMEAGVGAGLLRPTDDPRGRATVLLLWSLGALVLHEHAQRLLGVDLAGDLASDPAAALAYLRPATDILGRGVITDTSYEQLRAGLSPAEEARP